LWPQIRHWGLPKVQYTAREVVSGLQFLGFAEERSLIYAELFAARIPAHLEQCGIRFNDARCQTGNGSEFIGSWNAAQDSAFTLTVEAVPGLRHVTIPPGAHTWQADVEAVHCLNEDEFYRVETFNSRTDFLVRATAHNLWFNVARPNSYKQHQTPWEITRSGSFL
jgi:hypothetical protein